MSTPDCWRTASSRSHWWNVHNGIGTVSTVAGQTDYGDFGLLSSGGCLADGITCEPALNTPFAPYHALSLMNTFVRPGDQFVRAGTDQPLVTRARRPPAQRRPGRAAGEQGPGQQPAGDDLHYAGYAPAAGAPTVYSFTNGATAVASAPAGTPPARPCRRTR